METVYDDTALTPLFNEIVTHFGNRIELHDESTCVYVFSRNNELISIISQFNLVDCFSLALILTL